MVSLSIIRIKNDFMEVIEQELLESITRSSKLPASVVQRSKAVLLYDSKRNKKAVSEVIQSTRDFVYLWINRWECAKEVREELYDSYENKELTKSAYKRELVILFKDKYRQGVPPKFSQSDRDKIVALASESPADLGLPFTHWTGSLLQHEIIHRKIVPSISTSHIARILKNKQVATASSRVLGTP